MAESNFAHRLFCRLIVLSLLVTPAQGQNQKQHRVKVRRGTVIQIHQLSLLDSSSASVGDVISFALTEPLTSKGETVLAANTIVHGKVLKVRRAGANCTNGYVNWDFEPLDLPDGSTMKLEELVSYPYDPGRTGPPDHVSLDNSGKKIVRFVLNTGLFIVTLPIILPMMIAYHDNERTNRPGYSCGHAGYDQSFPPGWTNNAVVSKSVVVTIH